MEVGHQVAGILVVDGGDLSGSDAREFSRDAAGSLTEMCSQGS